TTDGDRVSAGLSRVDRAVAQADRAIAQSRNRSPGRLRSEGRARIRSMDLTGQGVYVVDAWDDDAQESYVRVLPSSEKARRALLRWRTKREDHSVFAGVLKRRVK